MKTILSFFSATFFIATASAQLVTTVQTPTNAVQNFLAGPGVVISNVQFTGSPGAIGSFLGATNLGIPSGVVLTTGTVLGNATGPVGPNNSGSAGVGLGLPGDPGLTAIAGAQTFDATILEFDVIPSSNIVSFGYVFGSEEYPEYVNSSYNDAFNFIITGPGLPPGGINMAQLPAGGGVVSINNVNAGSNAAFYVNNAGGATIQYDGFTTVLTATSVVQCGQMYHLRIAIADAGDGVLDSGIFLQAGSLTSPSAITVNSVISNITTIDPLEMQEGCTNGTITLTRAVTTSPLTININMTGTATETSDYSNIPNSLTFAVGQAVQTINFNVLTDFITEGTETIIFNLGIPDPCNGQATQQHFFSIVDLTPLTINVPAVANVCPNGAANLTSLASGGNGTYSYTWAGGPATANQTVNPNQTTTYTVTATESCANQTASASVTVTVNPLPIVNAGPDQSICQGATVVYSETGTPGTTFVWNFGNTPTNTIIAPVLVTNTVTGTLNGCVASDNMIVTINPIPIVNAGPDQQLCTGEQATIGALGADFYAWDNGGGNVQGGTFTITAPITYTVIGTTTAGCSSSDAMSIGFFPNLVVNAGVDVTICIGDQVTLAGSGATTYTWNNGVLNNVGFAPTATATYTVTGNSPNTCASSDQVTVTVNPLPIVNAGPDQSICDGDVVIDAESGTLGTTFVWSYGANATVPIVTPFSITNTVTGTLNGCVATDNMIVVVNPIPPVNAGPDQLLCAGEQATIGALGADFYAWDNGGGNVQGGTFTIAAPITFTVIGTTTAGCSSSDAMSIGFFPTLVLDAGANQTICVGEQVTLAGSGATTYTWDNGVLNNVGFAPTATATYTVTGNSPNSCASSDQVTVTVNPLPIVNAGPDQIICQGFQTLLNGSGAVSYTWNNGVLNGASFSPLLTAIYTVTGTSAQGCINTDQVTVSIEAPPVINFSAGPVTTCAPVEVSIINSTTGAVSGTWSVSDGAILTGNTNQSHVFENAGCYDVTYTALSLNGCISIETVNNIVCVIAQPIASFLATPTTVNTIDPRINFENSSSFATNYYWDFGDDANSTIVNPVHNYSTQEGQNYTIMLVASNSLGCVDTAYQVITVIEEFLVYVPNTFTPDGDLFNQLFTPKFENADLIEEYSLLLFNRWGEVIFESLDWQIGWDGTYGGNDKIVQQGEYTWKIQIKLRDNKAFIKVGNVALLR